MGNKQAPLPPKTPPTPKTFKDLVSQTLKKISSDPQKMFNLSTPLKKLLTSKNTTDMLTAGAEIKAIVDGEPASTNSFGYRKKRVHRRKSKTGVKKSKKLIKRKSSKTRKNRRSKRN